MANIGDLNVDNWAEATQRKRLSSKNYWYVDPMMKPAPDLVIGCPQSRTGFGGGRIMLAFLQSSWSGPTGQIISQRELFISNSLRDSNNLNAYPPLSHGDSFGQSLIRYSDMDFNG